MGKLKSRKQTRKEQRKAKKLKKHEFFSKKKPKNKSFDRGKFKKETEAKSFKIKTELKNDFYKIEKKIEKKEWNKKEFKNLHEQKDFEREKERKQQQKLNKEIKEQRIKQLKADNMKEDVEIKKLEKQLKMHKGKSKAFAFDGLDYLLDICDKKIPENEFQKNFGDSDSEFESDFENIVGNPNKKPSKKKAKDEKNSSDIEEESEQEFEHEEEFSELESNFSGDGMSEEEEFDEEEIKKEKRKLVDSNKMSTNVKSKKVKFQECGTPDELQDDDSDENEEDDDDNGDGDQLSTENEVSESKASKMWEDIYGRTRDEKGNVIKSYTPPHLRKNLEGDENSEKLMRLKKQLKGLLNRLAESNMAFISNQIEQLYMSNSRNSMNETLWALFEDSIIKETLTLERLIIEHAMLIAILHSNVGSEVGAHFLQHAVIKFNEWLESNLPVEDKRIDNVCLLIMHLYNFQIFHSKLMYDIINELLKSFQEKQIELLLMTFRTVGFNLRKDDPSALKSLVIKVQESVNSLSALDNGSRVKFMLEILMAIKNNNMSKIPNYNPEFVERLRKNLKVLIRKGNYCTELNISLQDLLNAEKHGRWWIVGSAWSGSAPSQKPADKDTVETVTTEFSQKLLDLARKQRMNTDVRRNIFCILMSAEDCLEAFEKLIKLKLKGAVEREIMNVLLHCALQEKTFNPYYVFLANKFCLFDRKYQMMLQCAVWDKIKELKNILPIQITNLAKFVGNMILEKGLPISVLKVVQFSELDKPTIKFMRQVLLTVLVHEDRTAVVAAFRRIADSAKLKLFRESLKLFLQHFVVKNTKNAEEEKVSRLVEMVKVAEQALESYDGKITF